MQRLNKGILITIEGIDGSGKSTLARQLADILASQHYDVMLTKEPGASSLGKKLRPILQTQKEPLTSHAEFLLFAADRAQHFHEMVIPALERGSIVISDRMADSSIVYQGYGRGLDINMIDTVNKWVMQNSTPSLTFYLKVNQKTANARLAKRKGVPTTFEREQGSFLEKIINGFDILFKDKKRVTTLDGTQPTEELCKLALDKVKKWIQHNQ